MSDLTTQSFTPKSFWKKPEGKTGMAFIAALGIGGFFIAQAVLPTIISVLDMGILMFGKLIVLGGLGLFLFCAIMVLMNPQFQMAVKTIFRSTMRAITGAIIEIDPIGIMRNYIDTLSKKKEFMDDQVSKLRGTIRVMKERISANEREANAKTEIAREAYRQNNKLVMSSNNATAERLLQSNQTLSATLTKMEVLYKALQKYATVTDVTIIQLKDEVRIRAQERDAILAASGAMRSAMSILKGAGPEKELFDQAMEFVVNDYGQRIGEIEDFMDTTRSMMEGFDITQGVVDRKAIEKFEAWEKKADSLVLGGEKRLMIEEAHMNDPVGFRFDGKSKVPANTNIHDDFNKFFN